MVWLGGQGSLKMDILGSLDSAGVDCLVYRVLHLLHPRDICAVLQVGHHNSKEVREEKRIPWLLSGLSLYRCVISGAGGTVLLCGGGSWSCRGGSLTYRGGRGS